MNYPSLKPVLAVVCLTFTAVAIAQPGPGENARHHGRDAPGTSSLMEHMHHVIRRLDLDDEQRANVRDLFQQSRDSVAANLEASRNNRQALQAIVTTEPMNSEALAAAADLEGQLAAEKVMLFGEVASQVYTLLDDEQRAQLQEMREQRQQHAQRRLRRTGSDG